MAFVRAITGEPMKSRHISEADARAAWALPYPATPYDLWTRTNVGEVFSNPITPLTWAVYMQIADAAVLNNPKRVWLIPKELFQNGLPPLVFRAINGRLFFNTGLIYEIATERFGLPSWFYSLALGGPREGERLSLPERPAQPLKLLRSLPKLLKEQRRLEGVVDQFERAAPGMRAEVATFRRANLDHLSLADLLARLDRVAEPARQPYTQLFDGSNAALNTYGVLAALAERWTGDRSIANDLVTGLANLLTAQASVALWAVAHLAAANPSARAIIITDSPADVPARLRAEPAAADVAAALERFFAAHGHRAADEFELAVPRWSEDPAFVVSTLRTYLDASPELDPAVQLERQRRRRIAAERRARRRLSRGLMPWRWWVFRGALKRAQRYLPMRENPKYHFLLYAAELRRTALAIGARLVAQGLIEQAAGVFMLSREELNRVAAGESGDLRPLVEARRALLARFAAWLPPESLPGDAVPAAELLPATADASVPLPAAAHTLSGTLRGIAASPGRVTARARIALTPEDGADLEPGEILVAPFTDPGWTPLFPIAGAIVMDLGGLLSHGAIVAREYGIPAVVNTRTATETLRTGQLITVDGSAGTVTWGTTE